MSTSNDPALRSALGSSLNARALAATLFAPAVAIAAVSLAAACGGKEAGDPKTAASTASSATPATSGPGAASGGDAPSSGGTTTTTALGDGGDLQGAKLGGSSHTEIQTAGDAGPKSTHGGSASEPGRTAKDIQAIIAARRDEARACYDKGLKDHPGIEGDLDIKFVIDPAGNVNDAQLDSTKSQILEPSVSTCIVDIIKKIKFAASAKGYETRAHYPFNFHPRNTGTGKDAGK